MLTYLCSIDCDTDLKKTVSKMQHRNTMEFQYHGNTARSQILLFQSRIRLNNDCEWSTLFICVRTNSLQILRQRNGTQAGTIRECGRINWMTESGIMISLNLVHWLKAAKPMCFTESAIFYWSQIAVFLSHKDISDVFHSFFNEKAFNGRIEKRRAGKVFPWSQCRWWWEHECLCQDNTWHSHQDFLSQHQLVPLPSMMREQKEQNKCWDRSQLIISIKKKKKKKKKPDTVWIQKSPLLVPSFGIWCLKGGGKKEEWRRSHHTLFHYSVIALCLICMSPSSFERMSRKKFY